MKIFGASLGSLNKQKEWPQGSQKEREDRKIITKGKNVDVQEYLDQIRGESSQGAGPVWVIFWKCESTFLSEPEPLEEVHVSQPSGFELCGQKDKVYRQKKVINGQKQGLRA